MEDTWVCMQLGDIHHTYPYDDTLLTYSDENVTRIHYLKSRKVAFCEGVYYYRQHTISTTHNISVRRFDFLLANEGMRRQLLSLGSSEGDSPLFRDGEMAPTSGSLYVLFPSSP